MDDLLRAIDFEKHDGFVTAIAQDDASGEVLISPRTTRPARC
jgi:hypothetical protein